jgi:hypothetical protein
LKVLKVLEYTEIIIADIEVNLGNTKQNAATLCTRNQNKIISLNTPDMRSILMKVDNAIAV